MTMKEVQERLVENMKRWQRIENATISATARAMEQTANPLLRAVMEVIQHDANNHHRIQQLIIDSLESEAINLSVDDLGALGMRWSATPRSSATRSPWPRRASRRWGPRAWWPRSTCSPTCSKTSRSTSACSRTWA